MGRPVTGKIWLRDAGNSAWAEVGLLGPPFTWTAVAAAAGGGASTGDVKATFRSAADAGWVLMNDGSIGTAGSGATARANADCEDLFALLGGNVANAWAPVQDPAGAPVGRGASAAADWAARRRLVLPRMLGRAIACAGWGADLSDRALGEAVGAESHALAADEMPSHSHGASTNSAGSHAQGLRLATASTVGGEFSASFARPAPSGTQISADGGHSHTVTVGATGGGQPHSLLLLEEVYAATVDPGASDDAGEGFAAGSRWINAAAGRVWVCADPVAGAAVWHPTGSAASRANAPPQITSSTGDPANDIGSGGGGLDAGSRTGGAWYSVWLIGTADGTTDALFSLEATGPAMPAGYIHKRRLGWVLTDASGNVVAFHQTGNRFFWRAPRQDAANVTMSARPGS